MGRSIRDRRARTEDRPLKFHKTDLPGVFLVEAEPHRDERGHFARLYAPDEFQAAGIDFNPVQINISYNAQAHTLRGLHYQDPPHAEAKLVQVTRGAAFDVVVDLRRDSAGYGRWQGFTLKEDGRRAVFIPEGCAHGFLTLAPDTDVLYCMGRANVAGHAKGYRFDDPRLKISWPAKPAVMSAADRQWPDFPG